MMKSQIVKTGANTSVARGPAMDLFLSEDDAKKLYEKWDNSWGEPYEFQGGQKAITAEQVASVPFQKLVSTYGKKLATVLQVAATRNAFV